MLDIAASTINIWTGGSADQICVVLSDPAQSFGSNSDPPTVYHFRPGNPWISILVHWGVLILLSILYLIDITLLVD